MIPCQPSKYIYLYKEDVNKSINFLSFASYIIGSINSSLRMNIGSLSVVLSYRVIEKCLDFIFDIGSLTKDSINLFFLCWDNVYRSRASEYNWISFEVSAG